MNLHVIIIGFILFYFISEVRTIYDVAEATQDQTSSRANTLSDDADDIQRQLDNESRDRIKYGRPKTIWVFHFPTQFLDFGYMDQVTRPIKDTKLRVQRDLKNTKREYFSLTATAVAVSKDWAYKDQRLWPQSFPACGGKSQSPVDLPYRGLVKAYGGRSLQFKNYNYMPKSLTLLNDGKRVVLIGKWKCKQHPFVFGGAAHGRRYLFHSLVLHWPSEHTVSGLVYPVETQAVHVSAEYHSFKEAIEASKGDPLAFLIISTLYRVLVLIGKWKCKQHPFVFGGAAHGRRYLFHSLVLHWPSEHTVSGLVYPVETQAVHVSAEYHSFKEAIEASKGDPLAFLIISTLYRFGNKTHKGLKVLFDPISKDRFYEAKIVPKPLKYFVPPFKEYASYQGSLPIPPCEEAVLWLIRGRSLSVTRELTQAIHDRQSCGLDKYYRFTQPLNDRKIFYFDKF